MTSILLGSKYILRLRSYVNATKSYSILTNACKSPANRIILSICSPLQSTNPRSIMICVKGSEDYDFEDLMEQFCDDCDAMGSDPYPYYKKVTIFWTGSSLLCYEYWWWRCWVVDFIVDATECMNPIVIIIQHHRHHHVNKIRWARMLFTITINYMAS